MIHAFKLLFIIIKSLIFENSDEYNIRSPGFKPKKMITFVIIILSISANLLLTVRLHSLVKECREYKLQIEKYKTTKQ